MTQHVGARRNGIWTGSVRGFKEGQPFPHCTTSKKFLGAKIFQLVVLWQCRANQGPKDYFCSWQKSQYVYGLCQRWGAKSEQMWHPPLQFTGINPNLQSTENASQSATKCKKKNEVRAGRCWCTTQGFALKKCTYIREWCSAAAVIYPPSPRRLCC